MDCGTRTAEPAMDHLGLVDDETCRVGRIEARSGTNRAIDVDNQPACATDTVVMIVVRPRFVDCRSIVHNQAPQQPGLGQMGKAVIDGLMRYARQNGRDDGKHGRRTRMRLRLDRVEHRDTLTRDSRSSRSNQSLYFLSGGTDHSLHVAAFLNDSRKLLNCPRCGVGAGAACYTELACSALR